MHIPLRCTLSCTQELVAHNREPRPPAGGLCLDHQRILTADPPEYVGGSPCAPQLAHGTTARLYGGATRGPRRQSPSGHRRRLSPLDRNPTTIGKKKTSSGRSCQHQLGAPRLHRGTSQERHRRSPAEPPAPSVPRGDGLRPPLKVGTPPRIHMHGDVLSFLSPTWLWHSKDAGHYTSASIPLHGHARQPSIAATSPWPNSSEKQLLSRAQWHAGPQPLMCTTTLRSLMRTATLRSPPCTTVQERLHGLLVHGHTPWPSFTRPYSSASMCTTKLHNLSS